MYFFIVTNAATPEIYTLSLHDALPISILLLHGEERFLVEEKARATLETWRSELVSDFGFDRLEGQGLKDRKSTRLNSSHLGISYAVFCLKKKSSNQMR